MAHWIQMQASVLALAIAALAGPGPAAAQATSSPYPNMAPIGQYRMASRADEIAMARSAAPAAISDQAEVLTLGADGYETAAKGSNGFVCIVERAWASDFMDAEFWNPKERAPICFNPASARSVLPTYLERTKWVLAGASRDEIVARTKTALAANTITPPEPGAMCYMMSKLGYLSDKAGGHWRPHLMFFVPRVEAASWGANLPGVPVMGDADGAEPLTVFFIPVQTWSDGTPAATPMKM